MESERPMEPLDYFWLKYRLYMGFDPNKPMGLKEKSHWKKIQIQRAFCEACKLANAAIGFAPVFDKQYFLAKRWHQLSPKDKEFFVRHVWLQQIGFPLYGYDWWLPYFEETGFITDSIDKPMQPITLYRGARPYSISGMSWTSQPGVAAFFRDASPAVGEPKKNIQNSC